MNPTRPGIARTNVFLFLFFFLSQRNDVQERSRPRRIYPLFKRLRKKLLKTNHKVNIISLNASAVGWLAGWQSPVYFPPIDNAGKTNICKNSKRDTRSRDITRESRTFTTRRRHGCSCFVL